MSRLSDLLRAGADGFARPLRSFRKFNGSRDMATAMIDVMLAQFREDGTGADERMLDAMMKRQLQRVVEPAMSSAKGQASKLLADARIVGPLRATPHLGALASLSPLKAARIDYVALNIDLLLQIKRRYPGFGLSSPVSGWQHAQGATGLELTQSWAVLHSWGHLFGTFATERALIFALERDSELEAELRNGCHSDLRPHVEAVLGSRDLHRVYYALAAWRASRQLGVGKEMLRACQALRLFFEHRELRDKSPLYLAYHRARQLAYHRIHSYLRLGNTCDFAHGNDAVDWILPQPELMFDQTVKAPFVELLDKFDAFQSQQIFAGPAAARLVLDHIRSFKRWWTARRSKVDAATALAELFQKPADWSDGGLRPLEHWCRLTLPGATARWTAEVRHWLEVSNWNDGNFLISAAPAGSGIAVDLYSAAASDKEKANTQLLAASARRLAQHCESALNNPPAEQDELWRSVAKGLASILEEKASIPAVKQHLQLILQIQSDEWWEGVTLPILENARKNLRALIKLIDKQKRKPIYTDFEDQLGTEDTIELPGFTAPDQFERFRAKARAFLREHQDHLTIHKLRTNTPLTASDLAELERMLLTNGVGDAATLQHASTESHGLGIFVRSLIGLDREAAKKAFSTFLDEKNFTATQIEFVNLIVNHLTEQGVMSANLLYESPFTDLAPTGPDGLFSAAQLDQLVEVLHQVEAAALCK